MAVDIGQVRQFVKEQLKGGTPKWIAHPEDYRQMVAEFHAKAQEALLDECYAYKCQDQDLLADPSRRMNLMPAAVFMRKLRNEGKLTCFSHDSPDRDGSASLFVLIPTAKGGEFAPICPIQVPLMWEWSLVRLDPRTQLPSGFRDIGWRSAVRCLVMRGILTEQKAHQIFGAPREVPASRIYRRMLCEYRNGGRRRAA